MGFETSQYVIQETQTRHLNLIPMGFETFCYGAYSKN